MRKYAVSTKKGIFYTTDFNAAMQVMKWDLEEQRKEIEKEKEELKQLQEEFIDWLNNTIPENLPKEEILKLKYEGGK